MTRAMCGVLAFGILAGSAWAQAPMVDWERTFGPGSVAWGYSVEPCTDGGYLAAGFTDAGGAGFDFLLVKTDGAGLPVWTQVHGGAGDDVAEAVVQTESGEFTVLGSTTSYGAGDADFWLVFLDNNGGMTSDATFGTAGEERGHDVIQTSDGGYVLAGHAFPADGSSYDGYVVRLTTGNVLAWARTYGGPADDQIHSVRQTSDGGFVLAGWSASFGGGDSDFYLIKTDSAGNVVWERTYGGTGEDWGAAVALTSDGGYVVAGTTMSFDTGDRSIYVVKTDAVGNAQWEQTYVDIEFGGGTDVIVTPDGGIVVSGWKEVSLGNIDVYLLKTDPLGNVYWTLNVGGNVADEAYAVRATADGGFILCGEQASESSENIDLYLIKLSPDVPLPVELSSFSAASTDEGILLNVVTASERDLDFFEIWRAEGLTDFSRLTTLKAKGNSESPESYRYLDRDVLAGQTYRYYVASVDLHGVRREFREHMVTVTYTGASARPQEYSMTVFPNPFNPTTTMTFDLVDEGWITLKVYTALGTEVLTLVNEHLARGRHALIFDGSNLASGLYFYSLNAGDVYRATGKMLLVK